MKNNQSRTFFNLPVARSKDDYINARNALIRHFDSNPDIVGLFEYGTVSNPGISDLDVIVVVKNNPSPDVASIIDKSNLPRDLVQIMDYASLIILPEKHFERILIWDDIKLTQLSGKRLDVLSEDRTEVEIARIVDWLPERILRLKELEQASQVNVRKILCIIQSFGYSMAKVEIISRLKNEAANNFCMDVANLRQNWFDMEERDQIEQLLSLVAKGVNIGCRVLADFSKFIENNSVYGPNNDSQEGILDFPNKSRYIFQDEDFKNKYPDMINGVTMVYLPAYFYKHFLVYSQGEGMISREITVNLKGESVSTQDIPLEQKKVLEDRIFLCNFWANFLYVNKFKSGLFKFGWFYNVLG